MRDRCHLTFDLSIGVFDASSQDCILLPRTVNIIITIIISSHPHIHIIIFISDDNDINDNNNNHPPVGHPAQHGLLGGEAALKQLRRRLQFLVHLPLTLLSRIVMMMMMMCKMVMYSYLSWCALGLLETNLKKGKDLCRN